MTPRQLEILQLLARGEQARAIADTLVLSEATVRNHIHAVLREFGVSCQLAAVARALDEVPAVAADDRLIDVFEQLGANDVNRALVLDDGRLVGLLSITDLARALEVGGPRGG